MAEQDLLPGNRVQSNEAQQWLPTKGYAYPALVHPLTCFLSVILPFSECHMELCISPGFGLAKFTQDSFMW